MPFPLALNTAVSFMTNTNWQAYSGEATMSYLTQMTGLAVHNFTSAATGSVATCRSGCIGGLHRYRRHSFASSYGLIVGLSSVIASRNRVYAFM